MIIGMCGRAGAGKDEVADVLVKECGFMRVSVADPLKRFCREVFGWTDEQLWGASHLRNQPDARWGGLTPRHALQMLGTEWGRAMHPDVWIAYALRTCNDPDQRYVIPDVRFANEADAIRNHGGKVIEVHRAGQDLTGAAAAHVSEAGVPRHLIDFTLVNDSDLSVLKLRARRLPEVCK